MESLTEVRGASELSLSHKVIAVFMSLVLALGLCPIAKPAQAYADDTNTLRWNVPTASEGAMTVKAGGKVINSSAELTKDAAVSVELAPAAGYEVDKQGTKVKGDKTNKSATLSWNAENTGFEFAMPNESAHLTASFKKMTEYNVTVEATNGTVTPDASKAYKGKEVTLTVTPNTDYALKTITADNAELTRVNESKYTFTMPEKDVKITATFDKGYSVNLSPALVNGKLTADPAYAAEGTEVTLTAEPNDGYLVTSITGKTKNPSAALTLTKKSDKVSTFTMPAKDVYVTATFAKKATAPKAKNFTYNGSKQTGVAAGEGYTLTGNTATNAGTYKATAKLKDGYIWADGTTADKTFTWKISAASIAKATVTLNKAKAAYTGKAQTATAKTVKLGKTTLKASDYTVKAAKGTNAGKYTVTVTGKGNYTGKASATFQITKAPNSVSYAGKASVTKSYKVKKLKKKAQKIALPKLGTPKFGKAAWTVSAKDKKNKLSLKSGKIVVKKGTKKGTYTIKLKATVPGTSNYAAASKEYTVKVKVKK